MGKTIGRGQDYRPRTRISSRRDSVALIAANLGEPERAVALLRAAYQAGMPDMYALHSSPGLDPLRDYPPFVELVRPREQGTVPQLASLPLALVGGVWLMWVLDYDLSVAVAVGFIALAGVATEIGVVMLVYLDRAWVDRGGAALEEVIERGAVLRVRPILMTVSAITAGLLPILWIHGTGASVMKRIAAPMVGGMVTATLLTLIVVPVLYYMWRRRDPSLTAGDEPAASRSG